MRETQPQHKRENEREGIPVKRTNDYEINHINNTVTVTKKFLEAAGQIDSREFKLLQRFKSLNLAIIVKSRNANKKKSSSPLRSLNKPVEDKLPLIPFVKMAHYISMLDDADVMMDEFDLVREIAKSEEHPRQYVNAWFRKEFPRYGEMPEFDENNRLVHNPNAA